MKIVFLQSLAGRAVLYLPGDLVDYADPCEAYMLVKAGIARAPTADETPDYLDTKYRLANIARVENANPESWERERKYRAASEYERKKLAALEAQWLEKKERAARRRLERAIREDTKAEQDRQRYIAAKKRHAEKLEFERLARLEAKELARKIRDATLERERKVREQRLAYRDANAEAERRRKHRAKYVESIRRAAAIEDAAEAAKAAEAKARHPKPRKKPRRLTEDERLVIKILRKQERATLQSLADCYEVTPATIRKTLKA